jgi:hypothetical protein
MNTRSNVKAKLEEGEPAFGSWIMIGNRGSRF